MTDLLLQHGQLVLLAAILLVLLFRRPRVVVHSAAPEPKVILPEPAGAEKRYQALLQECLDRQPDHEAEHGEAHPRAGEFTDALRVEAIARRLERKISAAGLPPLSLADRVSRAREALCRRTG